MKKLTSKLGLIAIVGVAYVGMVLHFGGNTAQARPDYSKAFVAKYPSLEAAKEAKCNVCHYGDSKKNRNEYGKAVGKAIGEANCKDAAKITAGLVKAEGEKSSSGETFGDKIKEGKLPAEPAK